MVVGVGGVGRAIALALVERGITHLFLANRDQAKARSLAAEIAERHPHCIAEAVEPVVAPGLDLLVNATSLGMHAGDALPVAVDRLSSETVVAEVIVNPALTPLLALAAERGCKIISGAEMLKPQPRLVAEFFGLFQAQD